MNPLLDAFLGEARELLEVASARFLDLESSPADKELLNELFRAIHTIKGASGLFEIMPFTRVVHAAEDVLDQVRSGELTLNPEHIDLLLDALDQVGSWLDDLENDGKLGDDAPSTSATLSSRLRALMEERESDSAFMTETTPRTESAPATMAWSSEVPTWVCDQLHGAPLVAIVYEPDEQCFFQGHDPLHNVRTIPELEWFDIETREPWQEIDSLDPYRCILRFRALSSAQRDTVDHHFRYVIDQVRIESLVLSRREEEEEAISAPISAKKTSVRAASGGASKANSPRSSRPAKRSSNSRPPRSTPRESPEQRVAREMLEAQRRALDLPWEPEVWAGRIESIATVIARLLPVIGVQDHDEALEEAKSEALAARQGRPLREFLESALEGKATPDTAQDDALDASARSRQEARDASSAHHGDSRDEDGHDANDDLDASDAPSSDDERDSPSELEALDEPSAPNDESLTAGASIENAEIPTSRRGPANGDTTRSKGRALKVDQARIDALMDLVGELVVAKNALPFLAKRAEQTYGVRDLAREIKSQHAVINRLAEDLQNAVMQVRMVPVGAAFQRFPRLVRDLSRKLNKRARLIVEGEETEADKNVVEDLADPLIHLIRNSLDHGIETPEVRRAAGKALEAQIVLRATQQDDRVLIEVIDDGKGIDPAFIKRKAYEKGVISETQLETISDADALQLIFAAGFSTAQQISDVSGRGVGMDVVRTAVQKVGGSVVVDSAIDKGTRVLMSLPLSMAVTRVMMIRVGNEDFGVPFEAVRQMVRISESQIRMVKQREAVVLRDGLLPLYRLRSVFRMREESATQHDDVDVAVLVVNVGDDEIGLIVDDFQEAIDIILKPLEGVMNGFPLYSGTALLGDGRVLLVLNLKELVRCR